jgi:hypothetical protein
MIDAVLNNILPKFVCIIERLSYLTRVPDFLLPEASNTYYYQSYRPHICLSDFIDVLWNRK